MNFCRLIRLITLAAVVLACREAPGQIAITESKVQHWTGFDHAMVVNGVVVAGVGSKPKLDHVETTITVTTAVEYKFGQLKARRLPTYEKVSLDEVGKGSYRFKSGAPEGQYLLEYSAFDPEKGIASDEVTVTLERGSDVITPIDDGSLSALSKESRKAMQGLAAGMAADLDTAAKAAESGQVKTVLELSAMTVPLDTATRSTFKKSMATLLEPKLGAAALPADAPKTLREIAVGFRSVK